MDKKKYNGFCITGFVLALCGVWFYWLYCIMPIGAIVFSSIGIARVDYKSQKGKALGIWGLCLGAFYTFLYLSKAIFLGAV